MPWRPRRPRSWPRATMVCWARCGSPAARPVRFDFEAPRPVRAWAATSAAALRFARVPQGRTRIDYSVETVFGRGLLWSGAIFQLLGLAAMLIGFWLVNTYVVPNPHPAIRGQTLQMLQVVHFLWPPFLFGWLHRLRYRVVQNAFDTLIGNMAYFVA